MQLPGCHGPCLAIIRDREAESLFNLLFTHCGWDVVVLFVQAEPRRLSYGTQEEVAPADEEMEVEEVAEPSTSSGANKENKLGKRKVPSGKDVASMLSNHLMCSICHEWLAAAHAVSCGHMFCGVCLANWMQQKQTCPECRKPIAGEWAVPSQARVSNSPLQSSTSYW